LHAQEASAASDAAKAQAWGANDQGLRPYVFVLLKTAPKRMPDGAAALLPVNAWHPKLMKPKP
ncbi:hypothetical protein DBR42_20495, partial [Pelomonas sp. HMWF004]